MIKRETITRVLAFIIGGMTLGVIAAPAAAQAQPMPRIGSACPSGYQSSGGFCVPGPNTKCRAFPSGGRICPSGYTKSFDYCVETGCQSR